MGRYALLWPLSFEIKLLIAFVDVVVKAYPGNHALRFDGKDDTVLISHLAADATLPDGAWTLEAWVKPDEDANYNQASTVV